MKTLDQYKGKKEGETCIVVGNGPSLAGVPRELLAKYDTFGANKVYLLDGFVPTFYTVIDAKMIFDVAPYIYKNWKGKEYPDAPEAMFIRSDFPTAGAIPIRCVVRDGFSLNPEDGVIMGGTVSYASLQIAYYMGYTKVLLVGVDHRYSVSERYTPGSLFQADTEDADHFHKEYFTPGSYYAAPEVEGTTRSYHLAGMAYGSTGRSIINLTPDSALKVFEEGNYNDYL